MKKSQSFLYYTSIASRKLLTYWRNICILFVKLEPLRSFIGRLISFVFISSIFLVATILVSFNVLLPGTIFKIYVFPALLFAPFLLGYIATSIEPRKFNEGFAQYESLKGFSLNRILSKAGYRFDLWLLNLSNPKILESDKLIIQSHGYPNEYIDVFYVASMEFMDYISTNYGGVKNILYRVSNGEQFSVAFEKETSKTYADMYEEWHDKFF